MKDIYETNSARTSDVILINSQKMFSVDNAGQIIPATRLERALFNDDKAVAVTRLAVDKMMRSCSR